MFGHKAKSTITEVIFAFEFAAAVAQLAGIAGIKAGRAAYVMFKSTYPSISGSRYLKKDTH